MADIFLSYASEDRERIRLLVERLEREGFSVWWDRQLNAGPRFSEIIETEIATAACMVVAWTKAALNSDWVFDEANEGRQRDILIPALLDDVRPPLGFRGMHTANLTDWPADH